jgi:hypothetical protein
MLSQQLKRMSDKGMLVKVRVVWCGCCAWRALCVGVCVCVTR